MTRPFVFVFVVAGLWVVGRMFWALAGIVAPESASDSEFRGFVTVALVFGSIAALTLVWILWDVAGMVAS